jgi:thymidylate kinase
VRAGYLEMAAAEPSRWRLVDSGQKWDVVQEALRRVILAKLNVK